mgnify:CR=1 FL=1
MALIPEAQRPVVTHQSGAKQIEALRQAYASAGVQAELTPFIDDTAQAFAQADLVISRAGASTVTELAAVGVASLLVPFPHAVDDHQTANAKFLAGRGAGWASRVTGRGAGTQVSGRIMLALDPDLLRAVIDRYRPVRPDRALAG